MSVKISVLVLLIVASYLTTEIASKVEFTNIICTSYDKEFSDFEYCYLKSVNRTYKYLSAKSILFKGPVTKVDINVVLYKRFNGYKPFLYNITADACRFLKHQRSNPILLFFFNTFIPYTNLNHSCPYEDAVIIDKVTTEAFNHQFSRVLPFPEGDYMIELNWIAYNINRAVTKFFFTLS